MKMFGIVSFMLIWLFSIGLLVGCTPKINQHTSNKSLCQKQSTDSLPYAEEPKRIINQQDTYNITLPKSLYEKYIQDLKIGEVGKFYSDALQVDKQNRCWLNPEAPSGKNGYIIIELKADGYYVTIIKDSYNEFPTFRRKNFPSWAKYLPIKQIDFKDKIE